jgi:hypothetical protein
MNEQTPSPARHTIAQELGADPAAAARTPTGVVQPLSIATVIRHITRRHPLAMLCLAFVAGAAYAGGRRKR